METLDEKVRRVLSEAYTSGKTEFVTRITETARALRRGKVLP